MTPCPKCGFPPPAPVQILPLGIDMERLYARVGGPAPALIGEFPAAIPWLCAGTLQGIDSDLLRRFGVIVGTSRPCGALRSIGWSEASRDLRHRAIEARALRLMMDGLI